MDAQPDMDVSHIDDGGQCYAFPGINKTEASYGVIIGTILLCD